MQSGGAAAPLGANFDEVKNGLFHLMRLLSVQVGEQLGQQTNEMEYDDQRSVEIGNISFWRSGVGVSLVTEGLLTLLDFGHGLFEYRHDITEVDWRMVRRTGGRVIWSALRTLMAVVSHGGILSGPRRVFAARGGCVVVKAEAADGR